MKFGFCFLVLSQLVFSFAHAQEATKWSDRITMSGDVRLRHEYVDMHELKRANNQERIRARVKFEGQVEDNLKATLQLASGVGQAVSTNQTLDDGYTEKGIYISQAYLMWSPSESLDVLGGKVKNTLYTPGDSELLFDADLNPEGTTANYRRKTEGGTTLFANGGVYWYDERDMSKTTSSDTNQYSAQLGATLPLSDNALTVGAGYHAFSPIKGYPVFTKADGGNSVTGGNYDNDYKIAEAFASYAMKMGLTVFAHYANNSEATGEGQAYLAGVMFGKTKAKGDWSIGYSYRSTEKDAVLGAIKDSDFANGETDSRGHRLVAKYQVGNATTLGLTYFATERNVSKEGTGSLSKTENYDRAQLDVVASF